MFHEVHSMPSEPAPVLQRNWQWLFFSFEGRLGAGTMLGAWSATTMCTWLVLIVGFACWIHVASAGVPHAVLLANVVLGVCAVVWIVISNWIYFALLVKRLHDRGKSGRYLLLSFVPLANIWLMVQLLMAGEERDNQYGCHIS